MQVLRGRNPPEQLCPQSLCSEVNEWTAAVSIGEKTQGLLSLSASSDSRNREGSQRWPVARLSATFLRPPRRCWPAAPKVLTLCSCCCCFRHCSAQGTSCPSTLTGKATLAWPWAPEISTTMKPRTKGICGTEGVRSRYHARPPLTYTSSWISEWLFLTGHTEGPASLGAMVVRTQSL